MIPTIKQILVDYAAGQISQQEAIRLIDEHLRLDRNEALEDAAKKIPSNWCDPLLSGKSKVVGNPPYTGKDIEALLNELSAAIRRMKL